MSQYQNQWSPDRKHRSLSVGKQPRGFSLFEILVVLAFLAIISGIVILNFHKLVPAMEKKPLDRVFIEAMQDARILAATSGNPVYLSFNEEGEAFEMEERVRVAPETEEDEELEALDFYSPPVTRFGFDNADETQVLFYKRLSKSNDFSAGQDEYAQDPVKYLVFHPSGVATPARVVIRRPDLDDFEVELDPFSSGPILKEEGYY